MKVEKETSLNELMGTFPAGHRALSDYNRLLDELEKERVRSAGRGVAALSYYHSNEFKTGDYGHSASLDDVIGLRTRKEQLEQALKDIETLVKKGLNNV